MNTHFSYTNTAYYLQPQTLISALQTLHVQHIRDGLAYSYVAPNLYAIYKQLAAAGIYADLVLPSPSTTSAASVTTMDSLLPNYPSAEMVEGPNEFDESGISTWAQTLKAYLPYVWQVGQDRKLPVLGPSLTQTGSYAALGNVATYMTYANYHAYWGGRNPETGGWGGPDAENNYYGSLPYDLDELAIDSPGRIPILSETGYVVNNTPRVNVIPESVEAIYEPRLLLHAWNSGVLRTYIYELMDEPSSTTGFGLMRSDLSARPAFTAISTLMGLLTDVPVSFTPQTLKVSITGSTTGMEGSVLQKSDGSFWLALWETAAIFDVNAVAPITVAPKTVTVGAPSGLRIKNVWSFSAAGTATSSSVNAVSVNLSIQPAVTLIKLAAQ